VFGTAALPIVVAAGTAGGLNQTQDNIADTSSRGSVPGTYHIKPDIVAPGVGIHSPMVGTGYITWSGTSMATPAVAGIAALMLNAFPGVEPWEIKARMMNTARPLAGLNSNSVFIVGAGFLQPRQALTSQAVVIVEHDVPSAELSTTREDFNVRLPFFSEKMPSLGFGSVDPYNNTMPLQIRNTGTVSRTYTIGHAFNSNPNNAANLSFSSTSINVAAGGTGNIIVTLNFGNNAPLGFYEGYVLVSTGGTVVARLPFAANLTETVNPAVTIETPNWLFNGTLFTLGEVRLSASSAFRGSSVLVEINKHTTTGRVSNIHTNRSISANGTINLTPNSSVNTFLPQNGEYTEILIYRNNLRQHLLFRQTVQPAVFSFK